MRRAEPLPRLFLEGFENLVGRHCSSSSVRSALAYDGVALSEAAVFGLGSGLGFFYNVEPGRSPSQRFNGRAPDLEGTFFRRVGRPIAWQRSWRPEVIRRALASGRPVLAQTDIHPIPYYDDVHFIGHGLAVIGLEGSTALVADIAAPGISRMSLDELRAALEPAHAPLLVPFGYGVAPEVEGVAVAALAPAAVAETCRYLLTPPAANQGVSGMRAMAAALPGWADLADGRWVARFGYQAIEKRGTGGGNFRYLYADFLREVAGLRNDEEVAALATELTEVAAAWSRFGATLKAAAFAGADGGVGSALATAQRSLLALADREQRLFGALLSWAQGQEESLR